MPAVNKFNTEIDSLGNFRRHLESYIVLNDLEFENILNYFTPKKIKKNEPVIKEGSLVVNTYWVIKGLLISSFTGDDGKEHIIQFATENCWITDQNAFYTKGKAMFNVVSAENSHVLSLSFENRERLCADMHKMERFFRKKANDSFVKQQKRLLTYMTSDAKERFRLLLEEYPTLIQRIPKKTLAAYLGVSRETLSRFKK